MVPRVLWLLYPKQNHSQLLVRVSDTSIWLPLSLPPGDICCEPCGGGGGVEGEEAEEDMALLCTVIVECVLWNFVTGIIISTSCEPHGPSFCCTGKFLRICLSITDVPKSGLTTGLSKLHTTVVCTDLIPGDIIESLDLSGRTVHWRTYDVRHFDFGFLVPKSNERKPWWKSFDQHHCHLDIWHWSLYAIIRQRACMCHSWSSKVVPSCFLHIWVCVCLNGRTMTPVLFLFYFSSQVFKLACMLMRCRWRCWT